MTRTRSARRGLRAASTVAAIAAVGLAGACRSAEPPPAGNGDAAVVRSPEGRSERVSPFSALRASEDGRVEVEVDGSFYFLDALNGIDAPELISFAQQTYTGDPQLWIKRLGEDLQQVLDAMGPGLACPAEVTLSDAQGDTETRTLACTEENRASSLAYNRRVGVS